jgi:hypothetical protein
LAVVVVVNIVTWIYRAPAALAVVVAETQVLQVILAVPVLLDKEMLAVPE